jgi:hypothetical protein
MNNTDRRKNGILWLVAGATAGILMTVGIIALRRRGCRATVREGSLGNIDYEFGETTESNAFWDRHPDIWPHFERLIALTNKCFGREYQPKNRAEDVIFDLGQACRDDFGEIVFLSVHGHGNGATKLLRGMFERAVTSAYLIKNPDKAERFVRFGAIQEHRAMEAALKVVSEKEFDEVIGKRSTVAEIRKFYQAVKPEFQTTVCSCGKTRTAGSWDMDVASMVHSVGGPFQHFYLGAYAIPNLQIHATLASTARDKSPRDEADFAFNLAFGLMLTVIKYQNLMYGLNMDGDIAAFDAVVGTEWMAP